MPQQHISKKKKKFDSCAPHHTSETKYATTPPLKSVCPPDRPNPSKVSNESLQHDRSPLGAAHFPVGGGWSLFLLLFPNSEGWGGHHARVRTLMIQRTRKPPANCKGDYREMSYVGIFYAVRKSGESVTHPKSRVANFRHQHMHKLIRGCMLRNSEEADLGIDPGDVYFISDGHKHGLASQLLNAFKSEGAALPKNVWLTFHEYSEASLRAQRRHAALACCHQVEFEHVVSLNELAVELRNRLNFPDATTWFEKLGPLPLPAYEDVWRIT